MSDDQGETSLGLFRALQRLCSEGRVALSYDYARLHHIDCPVALEADGNRIAYAVLAASGLALWLRGWWAALATLAAGAALYLTIGRRFVQRRIRHRVEARALAELALWQRLWRFGGIGLVPSDGGDACKAPDGNWMALVRRLGGTE